MADQQTQPTSSQQRDADAPAYERSQEQFDTSFVQQVSGTTLGASVDWAREYFDSIEQQVRIARRVTEMSVLSQIKQQIVTEAAQLARRQVLTELKQQGLLQQQR